MAVNTAIQKYRQNGKPTSTKVQKTPKPAKSKKPVKEEAAKVEAALQESQIEEEKIKEEAELQREIAEEIEKEAAKTSSLVKEDFTPVNSTRDQLILTYAPLIKYIAQSTWRRLSFGYFGNEPILLILQSSGSPTDWEKLRNDFPELFTI